jgi:hypothetical protein
MQYGGRIDRDGARVYRDQLAKSIEQRSGNGEPNPDPVLLANVTKRPLDLLAQMPGDPIGRLRGAKRTMLGREPVAEIVQACPQPIGDQRLV